MGKRSDFPKIPKDAYMTIDRRAVRPLLDWYGAMKFSFYEPCVGNGDLVKLLVSNNQRWCVGQSDEELDARTTQYFTEADCFITNPPWSVELLHPIIENLREQKPTWLLFYSDWMFTAQSNPYIKYCKTILPVGRLRWIPGTKDVGKDNCAWYQFVDYETDTLFVPKLERLSKL